MNRRLFIVSKYLVVIFISSVLVFLLTRMMPLSPEKMLLSTYNLPHTPENITALQEKWGLDQPSYMQYFKWINGMLRGDWGRSLISGISIKSEFVKRLPFSFSLGVGSLFLSAIMGFGLGYLAAVKRSVFEFISRSLALLAQAIPLFISSLIVIYIIGVKLELVKFFTGNPWVSTAIGAILIALSTCGGLSRVARQHFLELNDKIYVQRLHVNGFNREWIIFKHGYKPVIYALSGAMVSRFASIIGGSSVIEFAFGIPGINYFLIESIKNRDYYVIQTYLLLIIIWMVLVHMALNGLKAHLDKWRQS